VHTSPLTFIASANCARYVGATPALIDIDPQTFNIDVQQVNESLTAIIPVHYAGLPVELSEFPSRPRLIIEDASHALGARSTTERVGATTMSDMCVFSFHPVKPITTAEGGAITTNNADFAQALREFRSHGIVAGTAPLTWKYDAATVGYNYRITDLQAALGLSQLKKIDRFIAERNEIAMRYREKLAELPLEMPPAAPEGALHGYHLFAIRVSQRDQVFAELHKRGVGVQVHYRPVHHHSVSTDIAIPTGGFPETEKIYEGLISIPTYRGLTRSQQVTVISTLESVLTSRQ
jgi:dTDP-4-amino-4,6-dideoxygalactose transaminase